MSFICPTCGILGCVAHTNAPGTMAGRPSAAFTDFGEGDEARIAEWLRETRGIVTRPTWLSTSGARFPAVELEGRWTVLPDRETPSGDFFELKSWSIPAWNRTHGIHVHGVQLLHREDYLRVADWNSRRLGRACEIVLVVWEQRSGEVIAIDLRRDPHHGCMKFHPHTDRCLVYYDRAWFTPLGTLNP